MKYNFDKLAKRKNTNSLKRDNSNCFLPMWVADMDFKVFPLVKETLKQRVNIEAYGYSIIDEGYYESVANFFLRNHQLKLNKENIIFTTGVVPAISSMVRRLTKAGEKVLVLSPVYNIFYNSILNNGRKVVTSNLSYQNYSYHIDFNDLEEKLSDPLVTLMIFCNPHNPIGKIWSKEEIDQIALLTRKNGVIVISDEIHCDIVNPKLKYNSFYQNELNRENSILCLSASKAFNLAGLQGAAIVCDNLFLKNRIERGFNNDEIAEPNFFVIEAYKCAFNNGDEYLKQLNEYLYQNKLLVKEYLETNIQEVKLINSEATYLLWIDVSKITSDASLLVEDILNFTGLKLASGIEYGENAKGFIRMNIATSKANVLKGLKLFRKGIKHFKNNLK